MECRNFSGRCCSHWPLQMCPGLYPEASLLLFMVLLKVIWQARCQQRDLCQHTWTFYKVIVAAFSQALRMTWRISLEWFIWEKWHIAAINLSSTVPLWLRELKAINCSLPYTRTLFLFLSLIVGGLLCGYFLVFLHFSGIKKKTISFDKLNWIENWAQTALKD